MKTIRRGSKGEEVEMLQQALNAHGYGPLTVDGDFGRGTQQVVYQFQQSQSLTADGIVGPSTWNALLTGPAAHLAPVDQWGAKRKELLDSLPSVPEAQRLAICFAIEDLGKKESPDGSNRGPEIAHLVDGYAAYWQIAGNPYYPWCMIAGSVWTARGLGLGNRGAQINWKAHPFGHWFGGVSQAKDWAKKNGRMDSAPEPGHLFTMPRSGSSSDAASSTRAGHTGIIVSVHTSAPGYVVTVEGNVGNRVDTKVRNIRDLTGFIRWW
jgi:hypothetical protein